MAYERVSRFHPDKIADRIGGAIVDLAYSRAEGGWAKSNPRIAVEVLAGHGKVYVIIETTCARQELSCQDAEDIVRRIAGEDMEVLVTIVPQDEHLADNQKRGLRCGDNGIFRGAPVTEEQRLLTALTKTMDERYGSDGKSVLALRDGAPSEGRLTVCQSKATWGDIHDCIQQFAWNDRKPNALYMFDPAQIVINPLGLWTGGLNTDTGAINRKLGSDMGEAVTGGGLHGKDLSKMDVTANIIAHIKAQASGQVVTCACAIGDEELTFQYADGRTETLTVGEAVEQARLYILTQHGSFERLAEYGLIV